MHITIKTLDIESVSHGLQYSNSMSKNVYLSLNSILCVFNKLEENKKNHNL
jgi:hypothetical protein